MTLQRRAGAWPAVLQERAVGFVAGAAVGTAVPLLHARRDPVRIALAPLGHGLALVGRF